MTNTQFYIGIAIPSMLVVLGWLHQNTRLSDLRGDVKDLSDRIDNRLALIEGDQK